MKALLLDKDNKTVIARGDFGDPQDALVFLWDQAERADEHAGELVAEIDGRPVKM